MAPSLSVSEYYAGKSVFITGATGFIGKVLIEKLLRSCPDIKNIYLMLRPKKGQGTKERLDDFINNRVFESLHKSSKHSFEKLRVVPGDILAAELGMSRADRAQVHAECNLVFHCAACVRFDMPLRDALNLNTLGTKRVLELAEGIQNLDVFVHVSTAYIRCELEELEEKIYPMKYKPQNVMDCMNWMDDDLVDYLEKKIIYPQPNTYAYTKSLTEDLVSQWTGKFPIAIARPSIVTGALKEPIPGWIDNMNGPTGIIIGAGKGVIRTMHCDEESRGDIVPVDIVVNGCIVTAYTTAMEKPQNINIVNLTESGVNPITWGRALQIGRELIQQYPFSICLWYPGGSAKSNFLIHNISLFLTHIVPAYLIDMIMILLGQKTFMVKIQKRVSYGLNVLQFYTIKHWNFKNDNFLALQQKISKEDNKIFYMDTKEINWASYIKDYMLGARLFCCHEDPSTLPQARKLMQRLYILDKFVQILLLLLCAYFVYNYINIIFSRINVL